MKSSGVLVNKEEFRENFKLVFTKTKDSQEFFLILHQSRGGIFNKLKIGTEYFFNWTKGKKYTFINPYSIEPAKEKQTEQQDEKILFLKNLADKLKLKEITIKFLEKEVNKLEAETLLNNGFHEKASKLIKLLFIKHQELAKRNIFSFTDKEKQEKQMLDELKILFLVEYYYPNLSKN